MGDVARERAEGRQTARVRQLRERGGERDARRDADRRLHHRAHDRGHARRLGDRERGAHAAERLLLEHDHVGGVERAQPAGVVERADALVGRDRHVDPTTDPRQVVERRDRLLDVLEVVAREARDHRDRGVDVPRAVGVDAQRHTPAPTASRTAPTSATPAASRTFTFTAG